MKSQAKKMIKKENEVFRRIQNIQEKKVLKKLTFKNIKALLK